MKLSFELILGNMEPHASVISSDEQTVASPIISQARDIPCTSTSHALDALQPSTSHAYNGNANIELNVLHFTRIAQFI